MAEHFRRVCDLVFLDGGLIKIEIPVKVDSRSNMHKSPRTDAT